jgi:hypothetical protein
MNVSCIKGRKTEEEIEGEEEESVSVGHDIA